MNTGPDPIVVALTGKLPFILMAAGVLALFVSLFLLWLYRRAVLRSMPAPGTASPLPPTPPPGPSIPPPPSSELGLEIIDASTAIPSPSARQTFFRHAQQGPRRAATIYVLAGAAYALLMTLGSLFATRDEFLPIKFLWLFWSYLWPAVLTTALVAGSTWRAQAFLWAAYFIVLGILAEVALVRSPQLTFGQLILAHWLWTNGPATVLLLAFLNRRVRAVGPLVLVFMVGAVIGSIVALDIAGSTEARKKEKTL
jgi:hypothetical protein